MEEINQEEETATVPKGRRRLLKNAFVAGLGAMLATEVACGPLRGVKNAPAENGPAVPTTAASPTAVSAMSNPNVSPGVAAITSAVASVSLAADQKLQHLLRRAGF